MAVINNFQKQMPRDRPKKTYGLGDVFELSKSFDIFGTSIPSFTVAGSDEVRTKTGAILSMGMISITLIFAFMKLQHMLTRNQPNINIFEDKESMSEDDKLYPSDANF